MFSFAKKTPQKAKDLDEQTPLLVDSKNKEPLLLTQLVLEQQCKQHFLTSTASLSFVCSLLTLVMMMLSSRHQQLQDDGTAAATHNYSHWSLWMSALTSCIIISPLVALSQAKLVQLESWRQSTNVWTEEMEQLKRENQVLAKQVQLGQDAIAP